MRLATILSSAAHWGRAVLAVGAVSLLSACDYNFWRMDGHQSTIKVEGPVAKSQLDVFYVTCWVTLVIFILVGAVLAYASIKFKARTPEEEKAIPPEQGHGNPLIEIGLIGASVLALVVIAIPTLKGIWYTYDVPEDRKADTRTYSTCGHSIAQHIGVAIPHAIMCRAGVFFCPVYAKLYGSCECIIHCFYFQVIHQILGVHLVTAPVINLAIVFQQPGHESVWVDHSSVHTVMSKLYKRTIIAAFTKGIMCFVSGRSCHAFIKTNVGLKSQSWSGLVTLLSSTFGFTHVCLYRCFSHKLFFTIVAHMGHSSILCS